MLKENIPLTNSLKTKILVLLDMLIDIYAKTNGELPDDGEFFIDKDNRDEIIGYLGNLYDSVSFQKTAENTYLVKYSNKRK